jgi:hypothetical protein
VEERGRSELKIKNEKLKIEEEETEAATAKETVSPSSAGGFKRRSKAPEIDDNEYKGVLRDGDGSRQGEGTRA